MSRLFASYKEGEAGPTLPELCESLLRQQQETWPQLTEGYAALSMVRTRDVHCEGFCVTLQFNPQRIVSSGANVDPQAIRNRRCFLCIENLPPEQKGVTYQNDFFILCNPAPILDRHYTVAHVRHVPQMLEGYLATFLALAKDMSPVFTLFYNGPKCGASAPDHMHFQAGPTGAIPIEKDSQDASRRQFVKTSHGVSVYSLTGLGRQVIALEGSEAGAIERALRSMIHSMRNVLEVTEEPMVNMLCSYREGIWRLIVFPRRKHRPDAYFKEGADRILISPASIDMGGLVVTPIEKDFDTVDAAIIQGIFKEVSLDGKSVNRILESL